MIVLCVALFAAPLAAAGSTPSLVFLADGASGPVGDGILTQDWPDSNESKARPVLIELAGPSAVFVDVEEPPGTHLRGHVFAGIWPDAAIAKDARLRVTLWLDDQAIAEAMVVVNVDPSAAPDPASLVPPDPSDPEGAVYHALGTVLPLVLQPPTLVDLGVVDVEVPAGSQIKIGLGLTGADGMPPLGAAMAVKYDGVLTPSFLYLPWWSANPEAVSPQIERVPKGQSPIATPTASSTDPPAPASNPGNDSPGLSLIAVVAGLSVALWLRRP